MFRIADVIKFKMMKQNKWSINRVTWLLVIVLRIISLLIAR